jgi:hypothetical protein
MTAEEEAHEPFRGPAATDTIITAPAEMHRKQGTIDRTAGNVTFQTAPGNVENIQHSVDSDEDDRLLWERKKASAPPAISDINADAENNVPLPDAVGIVCTNFRLEWLCVDRVPFRSVRHLRNAWNFGKEIKIARDGTELDPLTGERLINEWMRYTIPRDQ